MLQRLGDDLVHRHPRIERRVRVLEHDLHLAAQRDASRASDSLGQVDVPLNNTLPDVARLQVQHGAAVVVLPQPDSPTSPSVSPG